MRFRDISIRRKVNWGVFLVFLLAIAVAGAGIYFFQAATFRQRGISELSTLERLAEPSINAEMSFGTRAGAEALLARMLREAKLSGAFLFTLPEAELFALGPTNAQLPGFVSPQEDGEWMQGEAIWVSRTLRDEQGNSFARLILHSRMEALQKEQNQYRLLLLGLVLALGLLSLALVRVLRRSLSDPIAALSATVNRIATGGDTGIRAQKLGGDEVGQLADHFNAMLDTMVEHSRALGESERRFRTLIESAPMAIAISRQLKFTYANPAFIAMYGFGSAEELTGSPILDCVAPQSRAEFAARAERREQGLPAEPVYEAVGLRKDGAEFHLRAAVARVELADGPAVVGFFQDITEGKKAEERLRENEARLRAITDSAQDAIIMMDPGGRISFWNPAAEAILGYRASEVTGRPLHGLLAPDRHLEAHRAAFTEFMRTGQGNAVGKLVELAARRKDGQEIMVALSLSTVSVGGEWHAVGILRDITEQTRAETELRLRQAQLMANLENTPNVAVQWYDEQGRILYWNPASEALYGWRSDEALGKTLDALIYAPAEAAEFLRILAEIRNTGKPFGPYESPFQRRDGTSGWLLATTFGMPMSEGRMGFVCMDVDITERKKAEEELARAQALLLAAIERTPAGMLIADAPDVNIRIANPAALGIRGESTTSLTSIPAQLHPQRWQTFWPDGTPVAPEDLPLSRAVLKGETVSNVEVMIRRTDGETRVVLANAAPVRDASGKVVAGVVVFPDITERKRAEQIIQRLSDLGRQLGTVSDANAAARAVAEAADELLGWDACFLKLRSAGERDAVYLLSVDLVDGKRQSDGTNTGREVTKIERRVMDHGAQLILREKPEQEEILIILWNYSQPASSLIYVPLRYQGRYLGLFSIQSYKLHAYTTASLTLLQTLADHAAGALERIRAEEAFHASEDRYGNLVNSMKDILYSVSTDGKVQYIGPQVRAYGFTETEMAGQDFLPFIFPEDRPAVLRDFQHTATTGEETQSTFRLVTPTGQLHWFEEIGRAVRDQTGAIIAVTGMLRDVTERKQAEAAQAESELRFRELFERSPDAVFVEDACGTVLDANLAACRLHGLSRGRLVGKNVLDTVPPEAQATVAAEFPKWMTGELTQTESSFLTAEGKRVPVEIRGTVIRYGGKPALLLHVRDITERKSAQERIRQQAALLDVSHDAVMVWDIEHGIQFMNPAAQELTGITFKQGRSQPLSVVLRLRSEVAIEVAIQEVTTKGNWSGELTLLTTTDKQRVVASRWTLLPSAEGKPASVLITCNDITEKKQLENQYLRAQRLESVGTLASGVAHDLNNILSPVLMGVELLGMQSPNEETRGILNMMKESTRRGVDTVKQLLTFARGTEAQKGPVQPRHLLKEIARLLQQTFPKNIQIYNDYAGGPATVLADPSQLHQVLMNLCVNARDAMPEGGVLFIRLENRTLDEVGAKVHPKARPQRYVVFKVTDSGTGIPPEILDRIFDPFFTTKPQGKGTGLGLATVLGIVEDHGGFVLVESEAGKGTTFQVFLPASAVCEYPDAEEEKAAPPRGRGELVLVVDDEAAILHLAGEILRHGGYLALTASNASEALHLYERNHDRIRAVLTDIMMPFGDGRQLITMLYEQNPQLPIIAMSGLATREFQRETLMRGARDFIRKPFAADELLKLLSSLLASPSRASSKQPATPQGALALSGQTAAAEVNTSDTAALHRSVETILVVEDDARARRTISQALRVFGYRVHEAANGPEALGLWQKHGAKVDLVLTDLMMPEGMTGLQLVERLRALQPGLKAIISTGYNTDTIQAGVPNKAGIIYLPKPYQTKTLATVVRDCLNQNPQP